jgi:ABC-type phosphate transport system ATPase subunit
LVKGFPFLFPQSVRENTKWNIKRSQKFQENEERKQKVGFAKRKMKLWDLCHEVHPLATVDFREFSGAQIGSKLFPVERRVE